MFAIREPKAAGIFYNLEKEQLKREIDDAFNGKNGPKDEEPDRLKAVITPHDRYHLCGPVCAWSFAKMERANYVIIGANHLGVGSKFAIMREGMWKTPLGEVVVANKVAQRIMDKSSLIEYDVMSHENEHSIECQLPFLQHRFGSEFKIVPISVKNSFDDEEFVDQCKKVGKAVAASIMQDKEKWVIIATSDFSRGPKAKVEKADKSIISSMKNLSEKKFFESVHENKSYVCGYGAILVAMAAAKQMKAKRSKLLKYSTSVEVLQDPKETMGYASIMIQ